MPGPSKVRSIILVPLVFALSGTQLHAQGVDPRQVEFFERRIRPVLAESCYSCHSEEARKNKKLRGGLLLDSRAAMVQGGDSGPVLVPGKAKDSLLFKSLLHVGETKMPPKGKLSAEVIAHFEHWINSGAADPRTDIAMPTQKGIDFEAARRFWSLQPVRDLAPPPVKDASWPRGPIDRFVLARLEKEGLKPVGDADRNALIRRVFFDLIGLPPTSEQVEAFARDERPDAFERVVNDLLASPHFGERWGRHWLDVARYAESNGRDRNMVWHHAWRYRDWVIKALNDDLPYDRFIRLQIAGDLIPAAGTTERDESITATGFLALGAKVFEELKPEVFRMDMIDEQIEVISKSFLALSVACARCHDHKFDPVPTRDYYALAGILRSTHTHYGWGPMGIRGRNDSDLKAIGAEALKLAGPALEHLNQLKGMTQKRNDARSDRYRIVRKVADAKTQLARAGADKAKIEKDLDRMDAEIKKWDETVKQLEQEVKSLEANPPAQPQWVMAASDKAKVENVRIHIRGETTNLGEMVPRGLPQVIQLPSLATIHERESGRRQLADWLAHPDNPLTPRVAVNRIWLHLFGRGLVSTPDDFGVNGTRPSHPELLDYLAKQFIADGWSVKKMIRSIVLSRTYQLASDMDVGQNKIDPDNVFLWRHRPRRLEAEAFRDAILAMNGQLDREPMKSSVVGKLHPYKQPEFNSFALFLKPEEQEHRHRSIYLPLVRGALPEILKTFDFPDPSMPIGQRDETIVPAQASFLMNSPWMLEQSKHLAKRLLADTSADDRNRIDRLFMWTLSRMPTEKERKQALAVLAQPLERLGKTKLASEQNTLEQWSAICQVLLASAEYRYIQ